MDVDHPEPEPESLSAISNLASKNPLKLEASKSQNPSSTERWNIKIRYKESQNQSSLICASTVGTYPGPATKRPRLRTTSYRTQPLTLKMGCSSLSQVPAAPAFAHLDNLGASIITNTILGVPCYNKSPELYSNC